MKSKNFTQCCLLNLPDYAFADLNITANVNQSYYQISITGNSAGTNPKDVSVKVLGPTGNINYLDQTSTDTNGNFSFVYSMKSADVSGAYQVYVLGQQVKIFNYYAPGNSNNTTVIIPPTPTPSALPANVTAQIDAILKDNTKTGDDKKNGIVQKVNDLISQVGTFFVSASQV